MALDAVPWLVGGGAAHSAEVGRILAYACADGGEGIIGSTSFRVSPTTVPGNQVSVLPGAGILHNNSLLPSTAYEAYAVRAPTPTLVPIAPTSSAGGRSDLVIARVEDPQYAPWAAPANPVVGPYFFIRVIQNVPAGTTDIRDLSTSFAINYPAITLARIDVPPSTATIQAAHIVDLRDIANPRLRDANRTYSPIGPTNYKISPATVLLSTSLWKTWPTSWTYRIPRWATTVSMRSLFSGVSMVGNDIFFDIRMTIVVGAVTRISQTSTVDINRAGETWNGERVLYMMADQMAISGPMRGNIGTFSLQIRSNGIGDAGAAMDASSIVATDLLFAEVPE